MSDWKITVAIHDMSAERADELFSDIADLVHGRHEEVVCSMGPYEEADDE